MGHTPMYLYAGRGHIAELEGVIGCGVDGVSQVLAHLVLVDIESGDEIDIADMISAQVGVHQAGDKIGFIGVAVIMNALN